MRRHTIVQLLAVCALLLGGIMVTGFQDNVGAMTDERADNLRDICTMEQGDVHYEFNADGSVKSVTCLGGTAGDWTITRTAETTDSGLNVTVTNDNLQEITIEVEDVTLATELPTDAATPRMPAVADQPMLVEAVVTWNPSAEAATEAGLVQINGCRMFGGTEVVTHPDGNPESTSFTVQCQDGLRNGFWCSIGVGPSTCFYVPGTGPDAMDVETPATMPTEVPPQAPDATPTVAATETATGEPTATLEPTPTDEPAIEPTFPPTTDAGPWTVPVGTIPVFEPVDPTPTPVILT